MPKVAVGGKLHPSGIDRLLATPDVTFDYVEEVSTASLLPMLRDADALILRTQAFPGELIAEATKLKFVARHGVGYDAVDIDALNQRRIPLAIVGDVNSRTVAEHAMTLILAAAKRLIRCDSAARGNSDWNFRNALQAEEVYGKQLLIIGFGRIGRRLLHLAQAFGMNTSVHDPFVNPDNLPDDSIKLVANLTDGLRCADYVSIHAPKTDVPILGVHELGVMKSTAVVINTARGGAVDELALATALSSGKLGAAGIDVFTTEPPEEQHPLAQVDTAILTPHIAGMTLQCAERMAIACVDNVVAYFNGDLDQSLVVNAKAIDFASLQCAHCNN